MGDGFWRTTNSLDVNSLKQTGKVGKEVRKASNVMSQKQHGIVCGFQIDGERRKRVYI